MFNEDSVEQYTIKHEKKSFRLLALLGMSSSKSMGFTASGANVMAQSRQRIVVKWSREKNFEIHPKYFEIRLKNEWRTVKLVTNSHENY